MDTSEKQQSTLYGLVAEFDAPEDLIKAAKKTVRKGYRQFDAFTPFPVHGLYEAMGAKRSILPRIVLVAGIAGAAGGMFLQYWAHALYYPVNIGGKAFFSWQAFIPVAFECTILGAAFAAVFGMFAMNGLPRPHHPVFNAPRFERASQDGFFLAVEAEDAAFDAEETKAFLESLGAVEVNEVHDED